MKSEHLTDRRSNKREDKQGWVQSQIQCSFDRFVQEENPVQQMPWSAQGKRWVCESSEGEKTESMAFSERIQPESKTTPLGDGDGRKKKKPKTNMKSEPLTARRSNKREDKQGWLRSQSQCSFDRFVQDGSVQQMPWSAQDKRWLCGSNDGEKTESMTFSEGIQSENKATPFDDGNNVPDLSFDLYILRIVCIIRQNQRREMRSMNQMRWSLFTLLGFTVVSVMFIWFFR